jgi:hypothetical protein
MKRLQFCLAILAVLALSFSAFAQVENGQFAGTVTDPTGAAISNAKITITNLGTNFSVSVTSSSNGAYSAAQLPVGTYKLSAEASGFKTQVNTNVTLNAGVIAHYDFKMTVGQTKEVVEVTGAVSAIDTETSQLSSTVGSAQVANLPLNGRNVYDLIQMAPGAVNANGVDFENGHGTVVNGLREDFNGFLINGVSNKGLSGGINNVPIEDTVEEFQQLGLNNSAQYGSSAGSVTNLVTKAGTNSWHGSGWEFIRSDKLDANSFFLNQVGQGKPKLRFNQVGGTFGGPIVKDKVFFFMSYQQDHFTNFAAPTTILVESPQFRQAVQTQLPNSVAALLFKNFPPSVAGNCDTSNPLTTVWKGAVATEGVTGVPYIDNAFAALDASPLLVKGVTPLLCPSVALYGSQTQTFGNLFQGKEASGRFDYQPNDKNRFFANYAWYRNSDNFGPCDPACTRGFSNPTDNVYPNGQLTWDRTFSSKVVNEFRVGYTGLINNIHATVPGVPSVALDDGNSGFGSYSGYPQLFKEHQYVYSDMVSISHGSHSLKIGVDVKRNIENSVFNVARPSYEFQDSIWFAADAPYLEVAGVDPGFTSSNPAQLASNERHWRNIEFGAYFQDDWKISRRLTLNLGMRYDLFTRHKEEANKATTFLLGPGNSILDNITTGAGKLRSANIPFNGTTCNPANPSSVVLAGVCGPGGFAPTSQLGTGDHNNFGPRVGFAWDVFGTGKTSLRGGFGVSYEGTLYNPLSNSRWNPPYYSFNEAFNQFGGGTETVVYGPCTISGSLCVPNGTPPSYLSGTNPGQGTGVQATGNINGWAAGNADFAYLTGLVFPGLRDPYVYNFFFGVQHEIMPKLSVEANYVGTAGHKLFRADDLNRIPGGHLPVGGCVTDLFGRQLCGQPGGVINPNYGDLRVWENAANSNYNAFQLSVKKQASHGLLFNMNYTWSHSIDDGSTWHSGATTANGDAAGDGFTTDWTVQGLDRGNSIYDIRHRLVFNYVWDLPFGKHSGFANALLGGWKYNGIWSFQSGAHFSPYDRRSSDLVEISDNSVACTAADVNTGNCENIGGAYELNTTNSHSRNSRPNSTIAHYGGATHDMWANGWGAQWGPNAGIFSTPCLGCPGNLGRNNFLGPGQWYADMSMIKDFKVTERVGLQFRAEGFNVFNHTNFVLAEPGQAALETTHNQFPIGNFGQAGGTLNARNLQFGVKLSF